VCGSMALHLAAMVCMAMIGACECGKGGLPNLAEGSISRETREVKSADGKKLYWTASDYCFAVKAWF